MNAKQNSLYGNKVAAKLFLNFLVFFTAVCGHVSACGPKSCGSPCVFEVVGEQCAVDSECNCSGLRTKTIYYSCCGPCESVWQSCQADADSKTISRPTFIVDYCLGDCMNMWGMCYPDGCRGVIVQRSDFIDVPSNCICD